MTINVIFYQHPFLTNPAPADGYKYIQKDTDSVDGAGKADGATANEDHKDIEGDHKDIQDTR